MRVAVGERNFPSKKALLEQLRVVLYRYPMGSLVGPTDSAFLTAALRQANAFYRYPPEEPITWLVQQQAMGRCPEFVFLRANGTRENPSIRRLSMQKSRAGKTSRMGARRDIVRQIDAFREARRTADSTYQCDGCSIEREEARDFEVDHDEPDFVELFDAFLYQERVEANEIKVIEQCDAMGVMIDFGMEEPFAQRWRHFHAKHAKLQLLCRGCHRHKTYGRSDPI